MRFKLLIFTILPLLSFGEPAAPMFDQPETLSEGELIYDASLSEDPEYHYEFARKHIEQGNLFEAKEMLKRAVFLKPDFPEAHVQRGQIHLWEGDPEKAYDAFMEAMAASPCNKFILPGLEEIAHIWEEKEPLRPCALSLYDQLIRCVPENCDYYLYKGRLLLWMERLCEAEAALKRCLEICPDYAGAAVLLANIYMRKERWQAAQILLLRFSDGTRAQEGLAKIAMQHEEYLAAKLYFEMVLCKEPQNEDAVLGLGRALYHLRKFRAAKREFQKLICNNPCSRKLREEYFHQVKPYSVGALFPEFSYTRAKENDPSLNAPVVDTSYLDTSLTYRMPVCDRLRLDARAIYFRQIERDIYPPTGINYDVEISGGEVNARLLLKRHWDFSATARVVEAAGNRQETYPFSKRVSFEPGAFISFNDGKRRFVAESHIESFIIKNFSNTTSELQRFITLSAIFGQRIDHPLEPQIFVDGGFWFYRDPLNNIKHYQTISGTSKIPGLPKSLTLSYSAEYSGYSHLSRNYYSYERQWLQILGIRYHRDFCSIAYLELSFERGWRSTRNLFQPVGNNVFVAERLYIAKYKPAAKIGCRFGDKLLAEVGGHYYRDTFPYRDYNVNASLLWYF